MKKVVIVLGILLINLALTSTVYAGSLNVYERQVIAKAKKTYQYNGMDYRLDTTYLNELINYLSSDDIDLTAQDRDQIIDTAFSSISDGVEQGYLLPVNAEHTKKQPSPTLAPTNNKNTAAQSGQSNTKSMNDSNDITFSQEETVSTDSDTTSNLNNLNNNSTSNKNTGVIQKEDSTVILIEKIIMSGKGTVTVAGTDKPVSQSNHLDNPIIKNTGFNMNTTVIVMIGMGMLMLIGIFVTLRSDLFAHKDE